MDHAGVKSISSAPTLTAALHLSGDQGQLPLPKVDSSSCCLAHGAAKWVHEVLYAVQLEVGLPTCAFNRLKLLQIPELTLLSLQPCCSW